jgi:hypothetical protein
MADSALFIGWGQVVRGREAKALGIFNETVAYYGGLQQAGTIESFEPVLLSAHGGDLAGFVIIRGDRAKLDALKTTEEFQRNTFRASLIVENLGVIDAAIGGTLASGLATYAAQLGELA